MELLQLTDNITIYLTLPIITYIIIQLYKYTTNPYKLPPGPPKLPILGSAPFLIGDPRKVFTKLQRKYGNLYTVYLGNMPIVVLNGYSTIKDCFLKRGGQFSARPDLFWTRDFMHGKGLVSTFGPEWKQQKTFIVKVLRDFGMGKGIMEDHIIDETKYLIEELTKEDTPKDVTDVFFIAVANVISDVLFSRRFHYTNSVLVDVINNVLNTSSYIGHNGILMLFPWLRHLPGDPMKYKSILKTGAKNVERFHKPLIQEHKDTLDPNNIRDFVDAYLLEIERHKNNPCSAFSESQLVMVAEELFGAGTETTGMTLTWAVVMLVNYPQIQTKIQEEICRLSPDKPIRYRDRSHLAYTQAFLDEVQRYGDLVSLGMPHATSEDVRYKSYNIPQGVMVMSNLCSVHTDPDLWLQPEQFNPARFLDQNGNYNKREELIPFSIGPRTCVGEQMARMELFMFLTGVLQKCSFLPEAEDKIPATKGVMDIVHRPPPFRVRCVPRKTKIDIMN